MNVRYPMGVLHSFSIKNIFFDKMDLRLFYVDVTNFFLYCYCFILMPSSHYEKVRTANAAVSLAVKSLTNCCSPSLMICNHLM